MISTVYEDFLTTCRYCLLKILAQVRELKMQTIMQTNLCSTIHLTEVSSFFSVDILSRKEAVSSF